MTTETVDEVRAKLSYAQKRLQAAREALAAAEHRGQEASKLGGGIPGFGGSGSQRAASIVRSALNSSHRAQMDALERVEKWTYKVRRLEALLAEKSRVRLTRDDVLGATFIHDGRRWRSVVKVNAKTVSVETGYSWVDRVPFDKITRVKKAEVPA